MNILIIRQAISLSDWQKIAKDNFGDMVKGVADIRRGIVAAGGELHADAEAVLLDDGSKQQDLWGFNFYPDLPEADCIVYTSLINIRPSQGNRTLEIVDGALRTKVRDTLFALVKRG